ncbi:roadblock/LC7 domain-containing protein [Streptomyces sp. NPDC058256]|uniref:roadblock/LC7 domain-containing protein n=1 Tax=Streptomyces sp. NPDC058256 TaxID=3346408 RepID=UPI0036ED9911
MTLTSLKGWINTAPVANEGEALRYDNLRDQFAANASDVTAIVLLAEDGLKLCAYGMLEDTADRVAAACSGLQSLGNALSLAVGGGAAHHHNITLDQGHFVLTRCGDGSVLIALVRDGGVISGAIRETVRIARGFAPQMGTVSRVSSEAAQ